MNRGSRSLVGLLTLFALSLFLAEGVWTATCSPASGESAPATMPTGAADAMAPGSLEAESTGPEDGPECPLGVIAIGGCVSAAVLSAAPASLPVPNAGAGPAVVVEVRPDLLLASSLFRPPRA